MEHYVTLFDANFAPQGLALHRSLQRHGSRHTLWVVCMDDEVYDLLGRLNLPDVRRIPRADIETEDLVSARASRTRGEYCWTLTPYTFDAVFNADPTVRRVTYVDADIYFLTCPRPAFEEFERSGAAVQITEHAYAAVYDQTATSGRYCVQFLTMDRLRSVAVRRWWQQRCLEWCFARVEDGKFGDQKYLDDWPERFAGLVNVAKHREWFQGPWNAIRFPYSEAIIYHFHGLRLLSNKYVVPSQGYDIPRPHVRHVYQTYLCDLVDAVLLIESELRDAIWASNRRDRTSRTRAGSPVVALWWRGWIARWFHGLFARSVQDGWHLMRLPTERADR